MKNKKKTPRACLCIAWITALLLTDACSSKPEGLYEDMGLKPRIVVLTDIAPGNIEPDDMESMIRLMAHADLFEVEALIASGGWNSGGGAYPVSWIDSIHTTINAYEKDLPNLMKRSSQVEFMDLDEEMQQQRIGYWPSADYMKKRVMPGSAELGQAKIGEENRSEGSDHIIRLAEENDPRPIWILAWGGANTFAQAIWQMEQTHSEKEVKEFVKKFRVYTITDQDVPWHQRHTNYSFSSHQRMRRDFSDNLIFVWDESAWLSQNDIGSRNWEEYATHIQKHGNLGRIYPKNKWGVEGDTPSYLHVFPNGLNDPSIPVMTGWGGYHEWGLGMDKETYCFTNHEGNAKEISQKYENYFYPAIFNNFAARMDWANTGEGNRNPIVIVNGMKGLDFIYVKAKAGETMEIDASQTFDPENDTMAFRWWAMPESGTYKEDVEVKDADKAKCQITLPTEAQGKQIHLICEVTDNGTPALTSYRRIIIEVE